MTHLVDERDEQVKARLQGLIVSAKSLDDIGLLLRNNLDTVVSRRLLCVLSGWDEVCEQGSASMEASPLSLVSLLGLCSHHLARRG